MLLQLFEVKNKKEEKQVMDYLNTCAKACYDAELERVMSKLENDVQKIIYLDWWNGGSLWAWNEENKNHDRAKRYKYIGEYDWETTRNFIMKTVSNGMG